MPRPTVPVSVGYVKHLSQTIKQMCSFAKSPEAKLCKKLQYHTQLLKQAAPKPLSTVPTTRKNKAAYQTPQYFQLSKKIDEKNDRRKKKLKIKFLFLNKLFHTFFAGGLPPPPGVHFTASWPALVIGAHPPRSPPAHHCQSAAVLQAPWLRSSV